MANQFANAAPGQQVAFPETQVNAGQQLNVGNALAQIAQMRMLKQRGLMGLGPGQAAMTQPAPQQ